MEVRQMLLHNLLDRFEDTQARRRVRDYLELGEDGPDKAEFLGHFLNSAFQPILGMANDSLKTIGYEAFVRPVAGNEDISPAEYFKELDSGNKTFVDRLTRELHVSNFLKQAQADEFIAINVSPAALEAHAQQFDELKKQIQTAKKSGLSPDRIYVELPVSPDLDAGVIYAFASHLREEGICIALEDFDADCASFSRIMHNKPDVVKFNRSWLDGRLSSHTHIDLVTALVDGVHSLGAHAHLERVENKDELNFAIACGFDRMQGYYIGQPASELQRKAIRLPL